MRGCGRLAKRATIEGEGHTMTDQDLAALLADLPAIAKAGHVGRLISAVRWLAAERERLQGVIAQHELCHDLHGKVDARAFADGCAAEQRRLYGCAPDADEACEYRVLKQRVADLQVGSQEAFFLTEERCVIAENEVELLTRELDEARQVARGLDAILMGEGYASQGHQVGSPAWLGEQP